MKFDHPFQFLEPRFSVEYHLMGTDREARAKAEALCLDQTVELPDELVPSGPIRTHILGRIENFRRLAGSRHAAVISFPSELLGDELTQVLSVAFGIASLKPGIRVARLHLPDDVVKRWPGPGLGREGLRERLGVQNRPLICGVLKPVGLSPEALADLAHQFAVGGLDLIKDDQGLVDQGFCPFDERITRCAGAVVKANRATGRNCLYFPNVTGSGKEIYKRSLVAKEAGAGGVLICPGLAGFDAIRLLAGDERLALPVMSHPTLLGSFIVNADSGIAPSVLFGQLPRLAGADISIYPTYGGSFPVTEEDCRQIATETAIPWGGLKPNFPTAAGRIHLDSIRELFEVYQDEMVIVVGGEILQPGKEVVATCREFFEQVKVLGEKRVKGL
jgi:ribulose-bisphosphate carboxylase large chain